MQKDVSEQWQNGTPYRPWPDRLSQVIGFPKYITEMNFIFMNFIDVQTLANH